ncbi:hypothetical protein [Nocardia sp. NPDC003963]
MRADPRSIHHSITDLLARDPARFEGAWTDAWPDLLEAALRATWRDALIACACCHVPLLVALQHRSADNDHHRSVSVEARNLAGHVLSQRPLSPPIPPPAGTADVSAAMHALDAALDALNQRPQATLCNGLAPTAPDDRASSGRPAAETVRVAVITTDEDDREFWKITTCPVDVLGYYDGEAYEIPYTIKGDVVVLDAVPGFPAGCATWSQFSDSEPDHEQPHLSELARARAEHLNCEHALFGGTPLDGWVQDPAPTGGLIEGWTFNALTWTATITRSYADPDTAHLSLSPRDRPTVTDTITCRDTDDAKRTAIGLLRSHILAEADVDHTQP